MIDRKSVDAKLLAHCQQIANSRLQILIKVLTEIFEKNISHQQEAGNKKTPLFYDFFFIK